MLRHDHMNIIKISMFSIFITCILFLDFAVSEVYEVGDGSGWNSGTGTNFLEWSEKYNFTVGDVLEFKYSKVQHNVKEVTNATYRSCDASDGVIAVYESGNDRVTLSEARKYNFICDKDAHCLGGMRFAITVFGGYNSNNTTPTEPPPPPPPSLGKNTAVAITRKGIHHFGVAMLIIFLF